MAKLRQQTQAAAPAGSAPKEQDKAEQLAGTTPEAVQQAAAPQPFPAATSAPAVPFQVQVPGQVAPGVKQNLIERRKEKVAAAISAGAPFTYKEERRGADFNCICGAQGKNAIVLLDKNGAEVLVGSNCLKATGVTIPRATRASSQNGGPVIPGLNKQQRFSEALAKYTAPYTFVREQQGPFTCFCGGRGQNQIVIKDANGAEFSLGQTCAASIPSVVVPKKQKAAAAGAPVIAGLKGTPAPPPDFSNVS